MWGGQAGGNGASTAAAAAATAAMADSTAAAVVVEAGGGLSLTLNRLTGDSRLAVPAWRGETFTVDIPAVTVSSPTQYDKARVCTWEPASSRVTETQ